MINDRIIECRKIIQSYAIAIAGIAAIPVPFSDFFLITPLQCAMIVTIAGKYDRKITFHTARELIVTITGGLLGRQICSTLIKFIPLIGNMISVPFAYGWTFGIGEMAILYFETHGKVTSKDLRDGFDKIRKDAEKSYSEKKSNPDDALESIREYMSEEEYSKFKNRISEKTDSAS
jgi:uncharacterized protein (DUF697 family)